MNKIISTKTTSSIFLAIVLIAGTFAAISPSSFITGVNAQSEYENGYGYYDNNNDDSYNSADYPSQQSSDEYEPNYENDDNYYSYPPTQEPISADIGSCVGG